MSGVETSGWGMNGPLLRGPASPKQTTLLTCLSKERCIQIIYFFWLLPITIFDSKFQSLPLHLVLPSTAILLHQDSGVSLSLSGSWSLLHPPGCPSQGKSLALPPPPLSSSG